jgi:UDP-perosamine 4-acetyltransferase
MGTRRSVSYKSKSLRGAAGDDVEQLRAAHADLAMKLAALEARLAALCPPAPDPSASRSAVIVGAGAHAKVVLEAAQAMGGFRIVGLVDPAPSSAEVLGVKVLGGDELLPELRAQGVEAAILAIGANRPRERLGLALQAMGFALPPVIHPSALISPSARIGDGVVVMARAVIGAMAEIGAFAVINTGAIVEHDNAVGRAAHIAPGVALAGGVCIGDRTLVGVGSAIRPGISIGADAVIGAGAAVVADRPANSTAAGVPARDLPRRPGVIAS